MNSLPSRRLLRRRAPAFAIGILALAVLAIGVHSLLRTDRVSPADPVGTPVAREARQDEWHPKGSPQALLERAAERAGPDGRVPQGAMMRAWRHRQQMATMQLAAGGGGAAGVSVSSWLPIGPGNAGGRLSSIAIHPTIPDRIWVGTAGGGIWKTENGGTHWAPVTSLPAFLPIADVILDPVDPQVMYAATGEDYGMSSGEGVFKSTNGGGSWSQLTNTAGMDIDELRISPTDRTLLIAAAKDGLWRSDDSGQTWTQELTSRARGIAFDPTDGTRILVGLNNGQIRLSTDAGLNWTTSADYSSGRVEVAFSKSNPQVAYAATENGQDLYRSTDGGATFVAVNTTTDFFGSLNQGWYDNVLWVDPTDEDVVLVGGVPLWRSVDGGTTFVEIGNGGGNGSQEPHADQHAIRHHPDYDGVTNRTVFVGNDGGLYRTDDVLTASDSGGWFNLNQGLGITQFYAGASDASGQLFVGGTQDNGTQLFTGNPNTWASINGGDGFQAAIDPSDPNVMYFEAQNGAFRRSTDGGRSSDKIGRSINDDFPFDTAMELDPGDSSRLYVAGEQLWRTDDVRAAEPLFISVKPALGSASRIHAFAIDPRNSDVIWVGHDNGHVFLTTNGTSATPTWTRLDGGSGLPNRRITSVTIDPNASARVALTFKGLNPDNLWVTFDGGRNWVDRSTGLPAVQFNAVAFHPANTGWVYLGTDLGVFLSEDLGGTWSADLGPTQSVNVEDVFFAGGRLFAVTFGLGVYIADPATLRVPEDHATIQAAIDAASGTGTTTIDIGPGTHVGLVNTRGKKVILHGREGADRTVVSISGRGTALVRVISGEGQDTMLRGLTLTAPGRRVLRCSGTGPRFERCRIIGSRANQDAGAVWVDGGASPAFRDCEILDSHAVGATGAMLIEGVSTVEMLNCVIAGCTSSVASGSVTVSAGSALSMVHCTVTGNDGGVWVTDGTLDMFNSIVWGNDANGRADLAVLGSTVADVRYCNVGSGSVSGTGNFSADPLFADAAYHDYRLLPGSPCLDTGSKKRSPDLLDADLRGCPRVADSDLNGGFDPNVGAHESIPLDVANFGSIQAAIDVAERCAGVVSVPAGTYAESLNLKGKSVLVVRSGGGVLIRPASDQGIVSNGGEDSGSVFSGLNIAAGTQGVQAVGVRVTNAGGPTLRNCEVRGGLGSGVVIDGGADVRMVDCRIYGREGAGVVVRSGSRVRLERCTIRNNDHPNGVGGLVSNSSTVTLINCLIRANSGTQVGGVALRNDRGSHLINCSVINNGGPDAGNVGVQSFADPAVPSRLTNCLIWGATSGSGFVDSVGATVAYSNVEGGVVSGTGNISSDPLLDGTSHRLQPGSPCVDAADSTALDGRVWTDRDGNGRFCDLPTIADSGVTAERGAADIGCVEAPRTWFEDVGLGKAGSGGVTPVMSGSGAVCFDDALNLELSDAAPNQLAAVAIGVLRVDLPLFGGTLVPSPIDAPSVLIDATGSAGLTFPLPTDLVGTIWVQAWVLDPGATSSLAASNGLGVHVQ